MIKNRRNAAGVLAVLVSAASALSVSANGFRLAGQDAFATARGEAFVATADNASAIYYNPAGITQLEGVNFRGGVYGLYYDPTFTPPPPANTNTFHNEHQWAAVPQGFLTFTPKDWDATFGLGLYSPYGGNISWPQDTGFRTEATSSSLTYVTINPVVALKLAPGLSIAGGVMVNYAKIDLESALLGRPSRFASDFFHFNGDGWSVGYNLGLLWQPHEKISLGATFRGAAPVTFEGETVFQRPPQLFKPTQRTAQMDLNFPLGAVFGISYRPTQKWNLEFNADYTDWSSFGTTTVHQARSDPYDFVPYDFTVPLNWQASWMYEFGVTRYFDNGWHASAGYVFNETSVPDAFYSPRVADLDRHFFSIGAGHKGRRFDFDVTYQFGYGPAHTVSGSSSLTPPAIQYNQNADGTYDFISHAVMLTVGLHF